MSARSVWPWFAAALVAVMLALWAMANRAPKQDLALEGPLFPALTERVEGIDEVAVIGAGNQTLLTLRREADQWVMPKRDGFPVDAGKLRSLLLSLANARRAEAKTSNPELYDRLAVEDVSAADAQGVMLRLAGDADSADGAPIELIVGQNVNRGSGTYVRVAGESQSWQLDRNIAVERNPVEWLQRELVNIPTARISTVTVTPAEGEPIVIVRSEEGAGDFELQNLPKGREPLSEFAADATAGLLDSLRFDDVESVRDALPNAELIRSARFETLGGLVIEVRSWREDGKTLAHLEASLDDDVAQAWAAADQEAQADQEGDADSGSADDEASTTEPESAAVNDSAADERLATLREELERLEQRFAGRIFVIPAFKAASLNRGLDEYLAVAE